MKRRRTSRKDENNEKPVKSKYFIQQPQQQQKHQPQQQQQQYQPQQHQPQQQQHLQEQNSGSVKSRDSTATTTTTTTTTTRKLSRKDFEKPGLELAKYLLGKVIIRKNKSVKVENKKV